MKKVKLNESDVRYMVNEVVKRVSESLAEGNLNNFTYQDVADEMDEYETEREERERARKTRIEQNRRERNEKLASFSSMLESSLKKCGVEYTVNPSKDGFKNIFVVDFGSDACNGRGINKEFVVPVSEKAIAIYNTIKKDCDGYLKDSPLHHGYQGIECHIPGPNSYSAFMEFGNRHFVSGLGKGLSPEMLYEKMQNSVGKINQHILTAHAELSIQVSSFGITNPELDFSADFDEEAKEMIRNEENWAQSEYDSTASRYHMGWGPTTEL